MLRDLGEYFVSFADKWLFWVGIVLLIPELIKKVPAWKKYAESFPHKLFWALAIVCFFLAAFQEWHQQREKVKEGTVYLRIAAVTPRTKPTNPDAFPIGEPLNVNVAWTVFGTKPAFNARQDGKVYLADDSLAATQERVVKSFQIAWEEELPRLDRIKEGATIFPGDKSEWFYMTYEGKAISEAEKMDIKFGRKFVFIVGAVRFTDTLGEHEAHVCRWLQVSPDGIFAGVAWHACDLWINQIDIRP